MKTIINLILSVAVGGLVMSGTAFAQNTKVIEDTEKADKKLLKEEQKAIEKKQDRADDLQKSEKNAVQKGENLDKAENKLAKKEKAVEKANNVVAKKERQKIRADKKVAKNANKIKKAEKKEADAKKEKAEELEKTID